jgi:hypothetical protein
MRRRDQQQRFGIRCERLSASAGSLKQVQQPINSLEIFVGVSFIPEAH